jgi:hydroxyethylthiazole kinase-like uncharacterized protein yjeF
MVAGGGIVDKAGSSPKRKSLEYITPEEMAELERRASRDGLSVERLMENAGKSVADFVLSRYGSTRKVCVVCGSGNNGGDGLVAARRLSKACDTKVVLLTNPERIRSEEARRNWERLAATSALVAVAEDTETLRRRSGLIMGSDLVVDSILGTGVRGGAMREPLATAIGMINASTATKVAVDVPSGLDPNTGVAGHPTVKADVTLALHLPKTGLRGRSEYTGEVVVLPIGIGGGRGR